MEYHNNRIMRLIETRLLTPSYVVMIFGLITRSVALGLSAAIPYSIWPIWIKLLIELLAVLAMVGCADLILGTASASAARLDRQIAAINNDPQYQPNPRLSKDRFEQAKAALVLKRDAATAVLKVERRRELSAVFFCGSVTVSYGILFAMTIIKDANPVAIATEIMGVASIPFITWYIAAVYKPHMPSIEQVGNDIAVSGFNKRLNAASDRFESGDETQADVRLLKVAVTGSEYHTRMANALAQREDGIKYHTTSDLYSAFDLFDSSGQSWLRRLVRQAGERNELGVIWDADGEQWLVPDSAISHILSRVKQRARNPRTRANIDRTKPLLQTAIFQGLSEQRPDSDRTVTGHA